MARTNRSGWGSNQTWTVLGAGWLALACGAAGSEPSSSTAEALSVADTTVSAGAATPSAAAPPSAVDAAAHAPPSAECPSPAFVARKREYLKLTTQFFDPHNILNVLSHLERSRVEPGYRVPAVVPGGAWDADLATFANLEDGRDFTALYASYVVFGYRDHPALSPELVSQVENAMFAFKYWYTEPTPPGKTEQSYYFSENHFIIYATLEYLWGERNPNQVFGNDGRLGSEHRDAARARLLSWIDQRSRFGFSEWHSNVYYQKDITPLLALAEFARDRELGVLAASLLDVLFFDLALHTEKGAFGVTHGRSFKKDKLSSLDEDTWDIVKLAFDNSSFPYRFEPGGSVFSRTHGYCLPEAIREVAVSTAPVVDRELLSVPVDELGPVNPAIVAPYGLSFTDPAFVDLWWGMNAFVAWPVVPLTMQTLER